MSKYFVIIVSVLFPIFLIACSGAEKGTGQALDNLGSAIRHESKKVWIPADEPATKAAIDDRNDEDRY